MTSETVEAWSRYANLRHSEVVVLKIQQFHLNEFLRVLATRSLVEVQYQFLKMLVRKDFA